MSWAPVDASTSTLSRITPSGVSSIGTSETLITFLVVFASIAAPFSRSGARVAAVDDNDASGDVGRGIAREVDGGSLKLFGNSGPRHRTACHPGPPPLRIFALELRDRRRDHVTRRDRIDPNAELGPSDRQRLRDHD